MPEAAVPAAQEIPASRLVVTSDNRAEFMQHRMDLQANPPASGPTAAEVLNGKAPPAEPSKPAAEAPKAPDAPPVEEVKKLEADLQAEEAKPEAQQDAKKKQGIRERLSTITQQRERHPRTAPTSASSDGMARAPWSPVRMSDRDWRKFPKNGKTE